VRQQLSDFARGLDAYKRLGLAFENVASADGSSNNIRVVFTLLDASCPERRCCFEVHVSPADDSYAITACDPAVADLPSMVAQLNATNQFAHFVQRMRGEFQALIRRGS
jgi:Chromosome segregation protein Spc25